MYEVRKPNETRECDYCHQEYSPRTYNQRYCDKCRHEAKKAVKRAYYHKNIERFKKYRKEYYKKHGSNYIPTPEHDYKNCIVCGAPFYPYTLTTSYYCSDNCKRIMERRRKKEKMAGVYA